MAESARLRLGYDATSLLGPRTGVGQMTAYLLESLATRKDLEVAAFALTWRGRSRALRDAVPADVQSRTRRVPARVARVLWARCTVPKAEFWTGPVDVVHATNFVAPPSRAPVIVTVPDLTFAHDPELTTADTRAFPRLIQRAIDRGAVVHAISDFVAAEIRDRFDVDPGRVVRIYPGVGRSGGGDAVRGRTTAGADRYVLALGTIEPRKNLPNLVRAFDAIAGDHQGMHLLIAGPDGWGMEPFAAAVAAARHGDRVRRLGYVDDATRRDLLAGATVLAYPSLNEGFGLPPLEAMDAGVPVVAADAGSLPEVLGDAALLTPTDTDSLAGALARVIDDEPLRGRLVARGHERVARYTWARAADEFTTLYRDRMEGR